MILKSAFTVVCLAALSGSGSAQQRAPVPLTETAPPDTIVYETTSWGRVTYHLEVHRDGRLRAWQLDFSTGERRAERDEQRSPSVYTDAIVAITPLSPSPTLSCEGAPTDGPSGHYHWHASNGPQAFSVDYGCYAIEPRPAGNDVAFIAEDRFFALTGPHAPATP